jgi:L-amino acid N-acyltransferase YncA
MTDISAPILCTAIIVRRITMATAAIEVNFSKLITLSDGRATTLRFMTASDKDKVLAFAKKLTEDDLLYLRTDITDPAVVSTWVENIKDGHTVSLLAQADGEIVGYASVHREPAQWTRRVAEMRVNVLPQYRGSGLGRALTAQAFDVGRALGLRKLAGMMTTDQRGARTAFERLGFTVEAMLTGFVEDRHGRPRDVLVLSHDLTGFTDHALSK